MFKYTGDIETDAAPSKPRKEEEITYSSTDEEEEDEEQDDEPDNFNNEKCKTDDIPDYEKSNTTKKNQGGGSTYVHTSNISIANCSKFQIGNQYHIQGGPGMFMPKNMPNMENLMKNAKPPPPPPPPLSIQKCINSREAAEQKHFVSIKPDIGPNLKRVAEKLGVTEATLQQLQNKYGRNNNSEVFYQMLLKWRGSKPPALATVGMLCEALWSACEFEAANTLAKLYS